MFDVQITRKGKKPNSPSATNVRTPAGEPFKIKTVPDPVPGRGEAVIAVHASGICHTDVEVLHGNYGTSAFPVVPGHEYSGVVLEVGEGVEDVSIGDRVVVDPNIECGTCPACRGYRLRPEALSVTIAGLGIHQVGELAIGEALALQGQKRLRVLRQPVAAQSLLTGEDGLDLAQEPGIEVGCRVDLFETAAETHGVGDRRGGSLLCLR